ncbi:hypothetical protein IID24_01380 [Patescibacteria group bacterium]|nr:hypothetical protein [Patescibacteria group bacterium]
MTFIDNSAKTSWKFIGVVAILAILVGGGVFVYQFAEQQNQEQNKDIRQDETQRAQKEESQPIKQQSVDNAQVSEGVVSEVFLRDGSNKVFGIDTAGNLYNPPALFAYRAVRPPTVLDLTHNHIFLQKNGSTFLYDIASQEIETINLSFQKTTETVESIINTSINRILAWDTNRRVVFFSAGGWLGGGVDFKQGSYRIYRVDLVQQTFERTSVIEGLPRLVVFSPNISMFFIAAEGVQNRILIYQTDRLEAPSQSIDVDFPSIAYSGVWHPQQNEIALGFNRHIYTFNLDTQRYTRQLHDTRIGSSYTGWEKNNLAYTSSGDALLFVDYDNTNQEDVLLKPENDSYKLTFLDLTSGERSTIYESNEWFSLIAIVR